MLLSLGCSLNNSLCISRISCIGSSLWFGACFRIADSCRSIVVLVLVGIGCIELYLDQYVCIIGSLIHIVYRHQYSLIELKHSPNRSANRNSRIHRSGIRLDMAGITLISCNIEVNIESNSSLQNKCSMVTGKVHKIDTPPMQN